MMISLGLSHMQERKMLPGKETRIFQKLSLVISSHKGGEFQIAANDDDALLLLNENRVGVGVPGCLGLQLASIDGQRFIEAFSLHVPGGSCFSVNVANVNSGAPFWGESEW